MLSIKGVEANTTIRLFDMNGHEVFNTIVTNDTAINVGMLPKAVYMMKTEQGNVFSTQKILIH